VALLVALGSACSLAIQELTERPQRLQTLRDLFHRRLSESLPDLVRLNGHPTERLLNTLNISIDGVIGEEVLYELLKEEEEPVAPLHWLP
jgi:cysteine desulfurase